jgi:hypothetical protein
MAAAMVQSATNSLHRGSRWLTLPGSDWGFSSPSACDPSIRDSFGLNSGFVSLKPHRAKTNDTLRIDLPLVVVK